MFFNKYLDSKLEAIIGLNSNFEGNIKVVGAIRIDGILKGIVDADTVIIGDKSNITGSIRAKNIIIGGKINGNVYASESVEMKPTGKLFGDIFAKRVMIAEGGIFEGRSNIQKEEILDFSSKESVAE